MIRALLVVKKADLGMSISERDPPSLRLKIAATSEHPNIASYNGDRGAPVFRETALRRH